MLEGQKQDGDASVTKLLHITALCGFAVAQPLYSLISSNTTFLVTSRATVADILLLALLISVLVPLALFSLYRLIKIFSSRAGQAVFGMYVFILVLCIVLPFSGRLLSGSPALALIPAVLAAAAALYCYFSLQPLRQYLSLLAVAGLIFPVWFLFGTPVRPYLFDGASPVRAAENNGTPVVFIIFDELPLTSLMTLDLNVDAEKFPHFAALADTSYWFRNTGTVAYFTEIAVPAILSGRHPRLTRGGDGKIKIPGPDKAGYPDNLFSMLAHSHRITAFESVTSLAPEQKRTDLQPSLSPRRRRQIFLLDNLVIYLNIVLPQGLVPGLPGLGSQWNDFLGLADNFAAADEQTTATSAGRPRYREGRINRVYRFIDAIRNTGSPQLYFLHTLLPHVPIEYLPSGKYYGPEQALPHGMTSEVWGDDPWEAVQGYQRHMLQLGFVDKLLGEITAKLKSEQLFDPALIIVTADHGESYRENTVPRMIFGKNLPDTLFVPLFIKLPGQHDAVVSDDNVQVTDILPTLAGVLEADVDWPLDGRDIFNTSSPGNEKTVYYHNGSMKSYTADIDDMTGSLLRKESLFGKAGVEGVYGPAPEGRDKPAGLENFVIGDGAGMTVDIENLKAYKTYDPAAVFIPANLKGEIHTGPGDFPIDLLIVMNGKPVAVTRTFSSTGSSGKFTAMIPEQVFAAGFNSLAIYAFDKNDAGRLLPVKINQPDLSLAPGTRLLFGRDTIDERFVVDGLSTPGESLTWSDKDAVSFEFNLGDVKRDLRLTAELFPFLDADKKPVQRVNIKINGSPAGQWILDSKGVSSHALVIPAGMLAGDGNLFVQFDLPDAAVPRELGMGPDARKLGVGFVSMVFEEK